MAKMTQKQVEDWIAQNGGASAVQYAVEQKSIKNPSYDPYDDSKGPQYNTVPVETWKNSKTGAVLSARRGDDGDYDLWESAGADPNKPGTGEAAPPGGKPFIDDDEKAREHGRRWGWNPSTKAYDRDLGPSPTAQEIIRNRSLPADQDPRAETDAERAQRAKETIARQERNAPRPVSTNTTEPFIVQAGPDGKLTTTPNPNYQGEKPQRSTVKGSDGKTYIVSVDKDGKATAAAVEGLPDDKRPGQVVTLNGETYWATPNADPSQPPTLTHLNPGAVPKDDGPQMEPGMTPSDYLQRRRAWLMEQRRAGVPQKEIDDIWARNVQEATARQNEASLAATQQNQRLSSAMSGFNQAMSSVESINKYLPEGSDLGGKALEAFLGIQRGQAQRMGGYGDPYAGPPSSMVAAIPGPPPMNPPKPSAPSPVGAVANGVTATTAAAVNPTGANVQTATDATMQGSRAAFGALGVSQLDGNERPDDVITVRDNISGETKTLTRAQYDEQVQNYPHVPQTTTVLDAKPAQAQASASPVSAIPESPYDFQARIASKPPWMMTEDDYRKAQQMGMEQDFWRT